MKVILIALAIGSAMVSTAGITRAEGLIDGSTAVRGERCFVMRRSPILDLSTTEAMRAEVEKRYEHSISVSLENNVVYSSRAVFPWALEARTACGKAIGYFKAREINEEMISKCDCFHSRMTSHLR